MTMSDRPSRVGPCPPTRRSWPPDPPLAAGHGRRLLPGECRGLHRRAGRQPSPPRRQHIAHPTLRVRTDGPWIRSSTGTALRAKCPASLASEGLPATRQTLPTFTSRELVSEPRTGLADAVLAAADRRRAVELEYDLGSPAARSRDSSHRGASASGQSSVAASSAGQRLGGAHIGGAPDFAASATSERPGTSPGPGLGFVLAAPRRCLAVSPTLALRRPKASTSTWGLRPAWWTGVAPQPHASTVSSIRQVRPPRRTRRSTSQPPSRANPSQCQLSAARHRPLAHEHRQWPDTPTTRELSARSRFIHVTAEPCVQPKT